MVYIWIRRTLNWADEEGAAAQITDPWLSELMNELEVTDRPQVASGIRSAHNDPKTRSQ